eukprot:7041056-Prymnesium_polylepis.1
MANEPSDDPPPQRLRADSEIRIRSACGTVVSCSKDAAMLSGFMKNWLETPRLDEQIFTLETGAAAQISADTLRKVIVELELAALRVKNSQTGTEWHTSAIDLTRLDPT